MPYSVTTMPLYYDATDMERISFHVPEEQIAAVEELVEASGQTVEISHMSKAEVLRLVFDAGMAQLEAGELEQDGVALSKFLD